MSTFISNVVSEVLSNKYSLASCVFILPSKRAGFFLKRELLKQNNQTTFAPKIISIENFIEEISTLTIADPTTLLFEFYECYQKSDSIKEKEDFDSFSSWALTLINDFSEIDRNLVPQERFFSYLKDLKKLEQWHVKDEKTPWVQNYISFWNTLGKLYTKFTDKLLEKQQAYQGLAYREAVNRLNHYVSQTPEKHYYFIGFNALNKAEDILIQHFLEKGLADAFWDADNYFMQNTQHSASHFLRKIATSWKHYQSQPFKQLSSPFSGQKNLQIAGCNQNIGQVKYAGEILSQLTHKDLQNTVVILADETLLLPVINSLPQNIKEVNITMGLPLESVPATAFFDYFLELHSVVGNAIYYKTLLRILNHPLGKILLKKSHENIYNALIKRNLSFATPSFLLENTHETEKAICETLFGKDSQSPEEILERCHLIIVTCRKSLEKSADFVQLETLYKLSQIFNHLKSKNKTYGFIREVKTLFRLFQETTSATKLDFIGEPHSGLQIMGLLETRVLDFETIILLSANEDILPSGKNNKSFITYDLKKLYGLPLNYERDAVYSYHFFRLIQRSQNIYLLYNNNHDGRGIISGEKSRFLLQLQYHQLPTHTIEEISISPSISITPKLPKTIVKTTDILKDLSELSKNGFSPTSLSNYIRNPIEFYEKYLLKIQEDKDVEETVAANTLGQIIHESLEFLYTPFLQKKLTKTTLLQAHSATEKTITTKFKDIFQGDTSSGKNKLIAEIAVHYVKKQIEADLELIETNTIIIDSLERKLEVLLNIPSIKYPVKLRGTADRIDYFNDTLRIIDYKTGKVGQKDLNMEDWSVLTTDYKYSKAFQVLCYAYMLYADNEFSSVHAGIISFKNIRSGFMPFNKGMITPETLKTFKTELFRLIEEICNPEIPFTEKEV